MTTVFLMRHSEVFKDLEFFLAENLQIRNEKSCLSVNGEKMALTFSNNSIFKNIDVVISSNYVRAISTAKYFLGKSNINNKISVISLFSERKHGVDDWNQLPKDFEQKQLDDINFKLKNGESRYEVTKRMEDGIKLILEKYRDNNVLVVSHATAITFLLMKYCEYIDGNLYFNNKIIIGSDFCWDYLDTFKLVFDDNNNLNDILLFRNNL